MEDIMALLDEEEKGKLYSLSGIYHENTKLRSFNAASKSNNIEISTVSIKQTSQAFKIYPYQAVKIKLPTNFSNTGVSVEDAISQRRSERDFSGEELSMEEISKLLHFAYGITGSTQLGNTFQPFRASPSAGALYPLEIYPFIFNVEGLQKGIYHYNVKDHLLELIRPGDCSDLMFEYTFEQEMVKKASSVFVLSALFERTQWKYGERGYRYILLDAGHLAENVYLLCSAMKLGCCTIGGFLDDYINELIDIDGVNESVIYMIAIGKPQ